MSYSTKIKFVETFYTRNQVLEKNSVAPVLEITDSGFIIYKYDYVGEFLNRDENIFYEEHKFLYGLYKKSQIASVELLSNSYRKKETVYDIIISINGLNDDVILIFENLKEAKGVFDNIYKEVFPDLINYKF